MILVLFIPCPRDGTQHHGLQHTHKQHTTCVSVIFFHHGSFVTGMAGMLGDSPSGSISDFRGAPNGLAVGAEPNGLAAGVAAPNGDAGFAAKPALEE